MAIKRRFECNDYGSSKFWQCWVDGNKLYTEHGRIKGGPVRSDYWEFHSSSEALIEMRIRIDEKLRGKTREGDHKKYIEVDSIEFETPDEYIQRKLTEEFRKKSNKRTTRNRTQNENQISKNQLKFILCNWLKSNKWDAKISWRKSNISDIEARKGKVDWKIEARGHSNSRIKAQNNFYSALGEILQRMETSRGKYSIAFPNNEKYKYLWKNLPKFIKEKIGITALFVDKKGNIIEDKVNF